MDTTGGRHAPAAPRAAALPEQETTRVARGPRGGARGIARSAVNRRQGQRATAQWGGEVCVNPALPISTRGGANSKAGAAATWLPHATLGLCPLAWTACLYGLARLSLELACPPRSTATVIFPSPWVIFLLAAALAGAETCRPGLRLHRMGHPTVASLSRYARSICRACLCGLHHSVGDTRASHTHNLSTIGGPYPLALLAEALRERKEGGVCGECAFGASFS